ncbi:MAG: ferrochelatase, partial [Planctomycetota bacterium]
MRLCGERRGDVPPRRREERRAAGARRPADADRRTRVERRPRAAHRGAMADTTTAQKEQAPEGATHGRPGVLLVNLGTPDAPESGPVRRYLRQFLSDPRVLDINPIGRKALLELIILPTRPRKSAEAYREVWTEAGSPLLVYGKALAAGVAKALPEANVELAMRYGNPSVRSGLEALAERGSDEIVVLPLFPQYASSSTGSAVEEVYREAGKLWNTPFVRIVPPYFQHEAFTGAAAAVARPVLEGGDFDHVLFSYHGVPERHVTKSDPTGAHCLARPDCCAQLVPANRQCYAAHCAATTRALVAELGLQEGGYSHTYQSRLGRTPWIQPFTDEAVVQLAKDG